MKKQIYNPYLPSYECIPDGEPRVFKDRLYIYGSHDCFGGTFYCENDYVCWSATLSDLSDWRYEGVIFCHTDHPVDELHKKAEKNGRYYLFAPDVIRGRDGRFYLYYSIADSSIISVVVCDSLPGQYIRGISNGCIVGYRYFEGKALQSIQLKLRGKAKGTLYVTCHEEGGKAQEPGKTAVGSCTCDIDTGDWEALTIPVQIPAGGYPLYFRFRGEGSLDLAEFTLE